MREIWKQSFIIETITNVYGDNRSSVVGENIKGYNRIVKPVTSISDDNIQPVQTILQNDNRVTM